LNRTNLKPRGFAGDSQLMKLVYAHEFDGEGLFSKFMHRHPLDSAACVAMRNTRTVVARATRRALERSPRARVLSVGCGPALELFDAVVTPEDAARLAFTLLDQDPLALVDAQHTVRAVEARVGRSLDVGSVRDSVRMMSRSDRLEARFGRFELVSAMGLFDALTPPVARQVLTRLYEVLEPGGELVLSNFHGRQSSRIYMEYWMDWVLYAREEEELLELAAHLPGAETSLSYEDTGSQLFLTVRKP
ncbi:MAG TPA: class I SAM-dependent methyltransferase, partial [Archangium sp.]